MPADTFSACLPIVLAWEGGKVNNPHDPGRATAYGVTQATYTAWLKVKGRDSRSVFLIAPEEVRSIYQEGFWAKALCGRLPPGVDLATFDASVNSGVSRGAAWTKLSWSPDPKVTIAKAIARRESFLRGLRTFAYFGPGWMHRTADIYAKSMRMAIQHATPDATAAGKELSSLAAAHDSKASKASLNGTGAASGGIGLVAAHIQATSAALPWEAYAALAGTAILAALYCLHRHALNITKARALEAEALANLKERPNAPIPSPTADSVAGPDATL